MDNKDINENLENKLEDIRKLFKLIDNVKKPAQIR